MVKSVEEYIRELRRELKGSDPALIQDALCDAEEFLRSELDELGGDDPEALAHIIERFGSPAEVAKAYRESDMRPRSPLVMREAPPPAEPKPIPAAASPLGPFFGIVVDPRAYGSLFYMFLSILTGIIYFTWVVTGISLSLGLLILIIGIPFFLLFLATTRAISLAEGWLIEALTGVRMPRRPRFTNEPGRWLERIKYWFSDYRTWTTLLYMMLMLPLGIIYFTLAVTLLTLALSFIAAPFLQLILNEPIIHFTHWGYYLEVWMMPFVVILGALLIILTLHLAKIVGKWHGSMAKYLLVGSI